MKTRFFSTIIILFLFSLDIFGQNISEELKNKILTDLTSEKSAVVRSTLGMVLEFNLDESLPILQEIIWKHKVPVQLKILYALAYFNAPNTRQLAIQFLDSLEVYEADRFYGNQNKLSAKSHLNYALFQISDYSKADYIIQHLGINPNDKESINLLPSLIRNVPSYENEAKNMLLNLTSNALDYNIRFNAVYLLEKLYGIEMMPLYVAFFKNIVESGEEYSASRIISFVYLQKYNYANLENLIKEQLYLEPVSSYKIEMLESLLDRFDNISNVNFLNNFYSWETDTIVKNAYSINLEKTKSVVFLNNETLEQIIDSMMTITTHSLTFQWIDSTTEYFSVNKLNNALIKLTNNDSLACAAYLIELSDYLDFEFNDSLSSTPQYVTREAWHFLYNYAQYVLDRLPEPQTNPNLVVSLKNSQGAQIPASSVKYYDASWKDAVDNGDGTFTVITTRPTVSMRVFYEYASQQADNVPAQNNTYSFQTVNVAVQLKNSLGDLIDAGTVQYYAGAWRNFGTTSNGVAYKELLPVNYSFRMTYEYGSIDKQQNLSTDPVVIFQTVNAAVQLKNSSGNLIDAGTVQYYAGAWRSFGTTSNGVAYKELLPVNYSFRMTHDFISNDKQQNLSTNPVVDFSTVLCSVKVSNTNNQPLSNANVKYYAGAWRDIGLTNTDGIITKEILPASISFRASYGSVSQDKQQNILLNSLVEFILNVQ